MAQSKKNRLLERAKETAPKPNPKRLKTDDEEKKGYRVVPLSFYTPEADWIDHTTQVLKRAGFPKANRSMVAQMAVILLQESLDGKSPDEVFDFFIKRQRKAEAA